MWGSSITFRDYPLEQAVSIMAGLGFTRVEMWKQQTPKGSVQAKPRERRTLP
jgi:hypothetical protein